LYHVENQKRKLEDQVEGVTKELVATRAQHDRELRAVKAYYEAKLGESTAENADLKRWFFERL
jgi:hypothetical protein